jgi:hypothetical protein
MIVESVIKLSVAFILLAVAYFILSKGVPLCKDNPLKHNEKRLCYMIGD